MKKVLLFLISLLLLISNIKAIDLDVNSKYAYCYNLTEDRVMFNKNAEEEIKVASLTKIMTAIIVIENNKDLNKEITVLDEDLRDMYIYSTAGFQTGNIVTIKDLLYGILLASGSDAVNAAVRITSDTEEEFVNLMNQKVKELNLTHTHFSNPIGKDEDNYSSMSDIASILKYCLKNKTFKEVISTPSYIVENLNLQINGPMYNSLNRYKVDTSIVNGSKAGYTVASMFSFVSYSEHNNIEYIVSTSYADKYINSIIDTVNIYNYFYNNYDYKDYNINFNLDINNGKQKKYNVNIDTKLYLENNFDKDLITYNYKGKNKIDFLIHKDDKLGSIFIYYNKQLIKTVDVKLNSNIEYNRKTYFKFGLIIIIIFILMLLIAKILKKKKNKITKKESKNTEELVQLEKPKKVETINIEEVFKEENTLDNKLHILDTTVSITIFFDNLKIITDKLKKENLERDFIDRCFEHINFKDIGELKDLYTKLKLYNNNMETETINYYNKLFRYCIKEYIDKK